MTNRQDTRYADEANHERANALERKVWGLSLIAAPSLLALSTLFWNDGRSAGAIQVYALTLMIPALLALFHLLRDKTPRFAVWGALVGLLACMGGIVFGADRIYADAFGIPGASTLRRFEFYDATGMAGWAAFLPGNLFPLVVIALGVVLLRTKVTPSWVAVLLIVGAIAFPISRIARIQMVAHISDALLLIPMVWIGWQYLMGTRSRALIETPTPA